MAENFQVKCAPCVEGLTAYAVPKHPAPIDLRLDGNEGSWPPLEIMERLLDEGVSLIRNYPSRASFESCLAKRFKTTERNVLATCGGDDALERACRAVLAPGRNMILPVPTFEMLERYARLIGAEVKKTPWLSGAFPIKQVLSLLDENTGAVCVVSPNNPTGAVASADDVLELSRRAPQALVILDLAYVEFADEDLTSLALSLPNVVAVRSLSKAWGLAGVRVGYAVGPAEVIAWMKAVGGPYSVSGPSLQIAEQRVSEGADEARAFVRRIRAEREVLERELNTLGAEPLRSQANFVCSKFRDEVWVWEALAGLGIAVRRFPANEDLKGYLRITCPGDEKVFARLLHAFS